jgi:hypothetical protein
MILWRCQKTAEFIHNPITRYAVAWQKNVNNVKHLRLMISQSSATAAAL